ncbi:MAG TPA: molecular chaperone HtpG [Acidiferrobacteraceae bacterium]|nr:molecular chaperone HtpG [Acidiferrobacteraceae bacterium]
MTDTPQSETLGFQTEVQQLLHLMIHSLYGHKEIFLRELISNASDACDRLRFEALTDNSLLSEDDTLGVQVTVDKDARTLSIIDNGIGMSREEVIEHIGTIARSGTKQFVKALTGDDSKDANLIGQFGVGFYSAFMVANKVTLTTRRAGDQADQGVLWESSGQGEYTVQTLDRPQSGTEVTLHIREGEDEYLEPIRLRGIIAKYSDHISLPIQMPKEIDGDRKDDGQPEWETINSGSALWARPKQEISEDEYNSFYSNLTFDHEKPLTHIHNRVEGKQEYTSLLFIPSHAPFDLWDRERQSGLKLYVRRIFIMDDSKHLMPNYLRFVRGIVDSMDLPLNVSREFLQHNKDIDKIRNASVKKILVQLKTLAEKEPDKYKIFWKEFGRALKEGIAEDMDNQQQLADLLRFATTLSESDEQIQSLKDYMGRMPFKQDAIYYLTADSHTAASQSPHLEIFRKKNIEVLLLSDTIDEWVVTHLTEYEGKPLKSIAKGALDLKNLDDSENKADTKTQEKEFSDFIKQIKGALKDSVKEVRLTDRLTDSPACLVADEQDMGGNLERILKSIGQDLPEHKPILEINPDHVLIKRISGDNKQLDDWAQVLFDQAALAEGAALKAPAAYVKRINALITNSLAAAK